MTQRDDDIEQLERTIAGKMAAALSPSTPKAIPKPLGELVDRYNPNVSNRDYMTHASSRQGYGAARTAEERFMDWRMWGRERSGEDDRWPTYRESLRQAENDHLSGVSVQVRRRGKDAGTTLWCMRQAVRSEAE